MPSTSDAIDAVTDSDAGDQLDKGSGDLVITNRDDTSRVLKVKIRDAETGKRVYNTVFGLSEAGTNGDTSVRRDVSFPGGTYEFDLTFRRNRTDVSAGRETVTVPADGLGTRRIVVRVNGSAATAAIE